MPKIYIYDGYPDLKERVRFAAIGGYDQLRPPSINYLENDITPDTCPTGVKAYSPQRLVSADGRLPDVVMDKDANPDDLPDIFTLKNRPIVSESMREIIEKFDPIGHEFFPCAIKSATGSEIRQGKYYHLWMRRMLDFEVTHGGEAPQSDVATPKRLGFLTLAPEGALFAAQQPLWGLIFEVGRIFMSAEMFQQFQSAAVTGLERYTARGGKFDATYGRVETVGVVEV